MVWLQRILVSWYCSERTPGCYRFEVVHAITIHIWVVSFSPSLPVQSVDVYETTQCTHSLCTMSKMPYIQVVMKDSNMMV